MVVHVSSDYYEFVKKLPLFVHQSYILFHRTKNLSMLTSVRKIMKTPS